MIRLFQQSSSGRVKWIVRPSSGLLFPAVDYMRQKVITEFSTLDHNMNRPNIIVVDCTHFDKTDFTAAQVRISIIQVTLWRFTRLGNCFAKVFLYISGAVRTKFENVHLTEQVYFVLFLRIHRIFVVSQ